MSQAARFPPSPIRGWMMLGPDFSQDWRGWKVYAENETGDMVPVKIVRRHPDTSKEGGDGSER